LLEKKVVYQQMPGNPVPKSPTHLPTGLTRQTSLLWNPTVDPVDRDRIDQPGSKERPVARCTLFPRAPTTVVSFLSLWCPPFRPQGHTGCQSKAEEDTSR